MSKATIEILADGMGHNPQGLPGTNGKRWYYGTAAEAGGPDPIPQVDPDPPVEPPTEPDDGEVLFKLDGVQPLTPKAFVTPAIDARPFDRVEVDAWIWTPELEGEATPFVYVTDKPRAWKLGKVLAYLVARDKPGEKDVIRFRSKKNDKDVDSRAAEVIGLDDGGDINARTVIVGGQARVTLSRPGQLRETMVIKSDEDPFASGKLIVQIGHSEDGDGKGDEPLPEKSELRSLTVVGYRYDAPAARKPNATEESLDEISAEFQEVTEAQASGAVDRAVKGQRGPSGAPTMDPARVRKLWREGLFPDPVRQTPTGSVPVTRTPLSRQLWEAYKVNGLASGLVQRDRPGATLPGSKAWDEAVAALVGHQELPVPRWGGLWADSYPRTSGTVTPSNFASLPGAIQLMAYRGAFSKMPHGGGKIYGDALHATVLAFASREVDAFILSGLPRKGHPIGRWLDRQERNG